MATIKATIFFEKRYWVGTFERTDKEGYATEGAKAVLEYGFQQLMLDSVVIRTCLESFKICLNQV